ncbi:LTA synthase family protein [Xanthobacter agilis]|uniref:Phosphoglycerol transferase MdoB-like AlkP superfamily enzyme n=1 Tax=Xanthobacter agilis TaxID=47492 RepID=A0ABU0LCM6_XANAG|nr:alkaline phosphatase family protein [Xanthobacter agilis]MDQ0504878.1 phosphoglycerol transferase MdoB-like AlkP superfamily enzyme [Xanthobacter agilis]
MIQATVAVGVSAGVLAALVCDLMERVFTPSPRRAGAVGRYLALRLAAFAVLFLFWLALSAREAFAATASIITTAVFLVISGEKTRYLKEPFVITDFAFLTHLVRHPDLFYLGWRKTVGVFAAIGGLVAFIVGWMILEPRTLTWAGQGIAFGVLLLLFGLAFAVPRLLLAPWPQALGLVSLEPARVFVSRLGLVPSLMVSGLALRAFPAPAPRPIRAPAANGSPAAAHVADARSAYDAVVVIQSESFYDLRRQGVMLDLAGLDALKGRALAHGRLVVPCYGAYTLRPEFAVSTGLAFADQGVDRFHPYLRARRFAGHALPGELVADGWDTMFIHPYDPHFFSRARAVPLLGFQRFLTEADFQGKERFGPYVADAAVGQRMRAEIAAARDKARPLYIMAVTMEAHDPYGAGRLPETDDPLEQYCRHAAHADALLASTVEALDALTERSLLVFYGDHAPLLPGFDMLADDPRTDYIVIECGHGAARGGAGGAAPGDCAPDGLNAILRRMLGRE